MTIWDSLRDWLAYECYGGTIEAQAIMVNKDGKREIEDWFAENGIKYSLIDYSDAPRPDGFDEEPSHLITRRRLKWNNFRKQQLLYFIPDHTQWMFAKMMWTE